MCTLSMYVLFYVYSAASECSSDRVNELNIYGLKCASVQSIDVCLNSTEVNLTGQPT